MSANRSTPPEGRPTETCVRCGRPVLYPLSQATRGKLHHVVKAIVRHAYYGCDTGCCGHEIVGEDCDGEEAFRRFEFTHPYGPGEEFETWARSLADEHLRGVPLDWPSCEVSDDC